MRISQLIARVEDRVIERAPQAKAKAAAITTTARFKLSAGLATLSAKVQPKAPTTDEAAQ